MRTLIILSLTMLWQCMAAQNNPTIQQVAFMAGNWVGELEGGHSQEVWAAPVGTSMIGMWKFHQGGEDIIYELLLLEETPTGVNLLLKHFRRGLQGLEEKNEALTFALQKHRPGYAEFQTADGRTTLIYQQPGKKSLHATLVSRNGETTEVSEFMYRRQKGK
ncbi:MAG: hypothetical protein H6555_05370 [Lewinellaceae bacterium]|nr:hypothetical protein [Lewinellaceae bacterium]